MHVKAACGFGSGVPSPILSLAAVSVRTISHRMLQGIPEGGVLSRDHPAVGERALEIPVCLLARFLLASASAIFCRFFFPLNGQA